MSEASWREARCDGGCGADHAEMHRVISLHIAKIEQQAEQLRHLAREYKRAKAGLRGAGNYVSELMRALRVEGQERDRLSAEVTALRKRLNPAYEEEPGVPENSL